jgi:methionine-rich copper-binding protein CopC
MTIRSLRSTLMTIVCMALLTLQLPAFAHTALTSSLPADEQTVSAPAVLKLDFSGAVSLLVLSVTGKDGAVDIAFTPSAEAAAQHEVALPTLAPGRYVVDWTILGADGHKVSKSFSFTVE